MATRTWPWHTILPKGVTTTSSTDLRSSLAVSRYLLTAHLLTDFPPHLLHQLMHLPRNSIFDPTIPT
jgi:hypothetical protein